jgi:lysylphosphatidylglycerol synthetase-like protein (DUF2156 family)
MINIIGLLILIAGFCLPYLIDARLSPTFFFWLGGLLSLNKGIMIRGETRWAKWAQIGVMINIALVIGNLAKSFLIRGVSITTFEYWLSVIAYWTSNPATAIGQQIFPYPETHYPDGLVGFQISYLQSAITAFLDVAIFAIIFAVIGIFWQKRKWKKQNSEHLNQPDAE